MIWRFITQVYFLFSFFSQWEWDNMSVSGFFDYSESISVEISTGEIEGTTWRWWSLMAWTASQETLLQKESKTNQEEAFFKFSRRCLSSQTFDNCSLSTLTTHRISAWITHFKSLHNICTTAIGCCFPPDFIPSQRWETLFNLHTSLIMLRCLEMKLQEMSLSICCLFPRQAKKS